ncbi:hypothetical protein PICMEDRAFT_14828 [Pichia membranifaciens NRRL Y-2026]|uniref:(S)-ureidoglycine aminohydrolase cupin domain-containing protein n=1 Tax=Pichia membranifaciens NRRL Y-2026 TaxID=763406 RepID=A0A1E3NTG9_9ASCO|nr:hypothetical protein PICMEDRAFT_14828 [Pichia membranifaciens NRRL Y-2026]ODQ49360.1 hypothetical protein PICMEDRAFT_14828 [Pichia membranifaciens NRRL Y-2026]
MPLFFKPGAESYYANSPPAIPSPGNNSWLGDCLNSDAPKDKVLSSGFYKQGSGEALVYKYDYEEMKVNVEVHGKFTVSDETGSSYEVTPGSIFYFPDGCTITFKVEGTDEVPEEEAYALNWFCGLRPADSA